MIGMFIYVYLYGTSLDPILLNRTFPLSYVSTEISTNESLCHPH